MVQKRCYFCLWFFYESDYDILILDIERIDEAMVLKGALPSRQLKLIWAWCVLHQDELMQNWELSKDGKTLNRIAPLV